MYVYTFIVIIKTKIADFLFLLHAVVIELHAYYIIIIKWVGWLLVCCQTHPIHTQINISFCEKKKNFIVFYNDYEVVFLDLWVNNTSMELKKKCVTILLIFHTSVCKKSI